MEPVTLKGRDLYSKVRLLTPIAEPMQDKNGEDYWRASFGKMVFTLRAEAANAFSKGDIAEMNLEPTSREVEDNGVTSTVEGVQYSGHLTYAVAKTIAKNEGELMQLENSFLVQATKTEVVAA